MKIGIVNIGDELLSGKILNSNQFDLSRMLTPLGHEVAFGLVIKDDAQALARALEWSLGQQGAHRSPPSEGDGRGHESKVDVLILTGGLGPTRDDLTRAAVAVFLERKVEEDPGALSWLCAFLGKDAAELPEGQRSQAAVPEGTEALRNPLGTACGFRFRSGDALVYAFPGVPAELNAMAVLHLLPELPQKHALLEKTLWTWGWSEGSQGRAFSGLGLTEPFRFSSLPGEKGVRLSLSCLVPMAERDNWTAELDSRWRELVRAIPSEAIVDPDGASMTETVQKLLLAHGATVSVAESCTGGGLGALLTELPGSSDIFQKGFITYSDQAKIDFLGVAPEILKTHGAVSEETALAMVRGCLDRSGATFACAITGIAGPGGGSPEKPVGTVWIGVALRETGPGKGLVKARRFQFRGNRAGVRSRSCYTALNLLRLLISEKLN